MNAPSPEYDIFLSFDTNDALQAKEIGDAAQERDLKVFQASRRLQAGDDWPDTLRRALHDSAELCVLFTPRSVQSTWVAIEGGAFWALGRRINPIFSQCRLEDIPELFRNRYQCEDFSRLHLVLDQIATRLGKSTELTVRAVDGSGDPLFARSAAIYNQTDPATRDPMQRVGMWLDEGNVDPRELYLVASFQRSLVGVLYATVYSQTRLRGCFVNNFAIAKNLPKSIQRQVSKALVEGLIGSVQTLAASLDAFCFEIPKPPRGRSQFARHQWPLFLIGLPTGWHASTFTGVRHVQPDLSGDRDSRREVTADLVLVSQSAPTSMASRDFKSRILGFVFDTFYAETYIRGELGSQHVRYINTVKAKVTGSVAERVSLRAM